MVDILDLFLCTECSTRLSGMSSTSSTSSTSSSRLEYIREAVYSTVLVHVRMEGKSSSTLTFRLMIGKMARRGSCASTKRDWIKLPSDYENGSKRRISFAGRLLRGPRQRDQRAFQTTIHQIQSESCAVWFLVLECATATNHTRISLVQHRNGRE